MQAAVLTRFRGRRLGLAFASLFVAALVAGLAVPLDRALAARPSFVVIQTDDQNADTVRARLRAKVGGFERVMPHALGEIVGKGTEFRNYYASSPVCSPSRASLLSGQYPWNSGLESNQGPGGGWTGWQNQDIYRENLAVTLKRAGYLTSHIGKFTNGYYDRQAGRVESTVPPGWTDWFTTSYIRGTHFYGYQLNVNGRVIGPIGNPNYRQRGPGIDPADCHLDDLDRIWPRGDCLYSGDVFTAAAARSIERAGNRPFYVQVDFQAPHGDVAGPRGPQPATRRLNSAAGTPLPKPPSFNEADFSDKPELIRSLAPEIMGRDDRRRLKHSYRRYLESIRSVDDGIGAIMRALRNAGKLRSTYVFLLSDHGLFLGEHRYDWGKFMPYEESSSPFLALRGPGVRPGAVSHEVVGNIDVPATIIRLAGATPDYEIDGRSLQPFWRDPDLRTRRPMAITIGPGRDHAKATASARAPALQYRGFRVGPYKYIRYSRGGEELYDLSTDPYELENRADDPRYEKQLNWMRSNLGEVTNCEAAGCRAELPPWP